MSRTIRTAPAPSCPTCGAKMVLRRPPPGKTWDPFWGCNRYPNCKGVRHIDFETGEVFTDDEEEDETEKRFQEVMRPLVRDLRRDILKDE